MKTYGETCGLCNGRTPGRVGGALVLAADAQHEIDARDEQIHDLKVLLRRAADNIGSWYPVCGAEARLVADIEKALS